MELYQLKYFIELVNTKNFTRAAQNINITQPTLTRVLKELESELNTTLIERSSKSFVITDTGKVLYEEANKLIHHSEMISNRINDIQHLKTGEVRLAIPSVLLPLYFAPMFIEFRKLYPNIKIYVYEHASKPGLQSLMDEKVDIVFMMMPLSHPCLSYHIVLSDICTAVVKQSSLCALQDSIDIRQLLNKKIATFTPGATLHDFLIERCNDIGVDLNIIYKSMNVEFLMDMVKYTDCIGIFPSPVIRHYIIDGLVEKPFTEPIPWEIAMGYKKNSYMSNACKYFIDFALDYFNKINNK